MTTATTPKFEMLDATFATQERAVTWAGHVAWQGKRRCRVTLDRKTRDGVPPRWRVEVTPKGSYPDRFGVE